MSQGKPDKPVYNLAWVCVLSCYKRHKLLKLVGPVRSIRYTGCEKIWNKRFKWMSPQPTMRDYLPSSVFWLLVLWRILWEDQTFGKHTCCTEIFGCLNLLSESFRFSESIRLSYC